MPEENFLSLFSKLSPERTRTVSRMAQVLCEVADSQPIGRRSIAARLSVTEREVRSIAEELKALGFLDADASGMKLTGAAHELLPGCRALSRRFFALGSVEQRLCRLLKTESVTVVPGDADTDPRVLQDVGRSAARVLRDCLRGNSVLAVGAGSTMAEVARRLHPASMDQLMVVPLRGGVGPLMEDQANVIAAEIASRLGGKYRLLHLPDSPGTEAVRELLKQDEVLKTLQLIRQADVIMHGIGRADEMAEKRGLSPAVRARIREGGAVGEIFGAFFDKDGRTVCRLETFDADGPQISEMCRVIAAAAGARKAQAIIACLKRERNASLICDEGAASAMLTILEPSA